MCFNKKFNLYLTNKFVILSFVNKYKCLRENYVRREHKIFTFMGNKLTKKDKKYMIFDTKAIDDFEELQKSLKKVIDDLQIKKKALYNHLGMARETFENKLKNQGFNIAQMREICKYFNKYEKENGGNA